MDNASVPDTVTWIAADWGTTHLRLWALDAENRVLAVSRSDEGSMRLQGSSFEAALLRRIEPWLPETGGPPIPVIACGMIGARGGWQEIPYAAAPLDPSSLHPVEVPTQDPRIRFTIQPGVSQAVPADIIRGEETQITGAIRLSGGADGVLCLPGTHSKWVRVQAGRIIRFQTAMTGELFDLLSHQSVLRDVTTPAPDEPGDNGAQTHARAFEDGVEDALAKPHNLLHWLFRLRAENRLNNLPRRLARARLSGLLIGSELAGARDFWDGEAVRIVGANTLAALYQDALRTAGTTATRIDATKATLEGLSIAHDLYRTPVLQ